MAMKIEFDSNHNPITPSIILTNRNGNKLGLLTNVYNIIVNGSIDIPEISFNILKEDNGIVCNLWDSIKDFKLIWCKEWDMWFEIFVELQDSSNGTIKSVTATALCQSELSQIMLYEIEINTEDDIARDDYRIPTTIYNPEHPEASLLNRITEKAPHYSIEHVDSSLMNIQKTFTFNDKSLKDSLDEIAQEIECLVLYGNTTDDARINGISMPKRTISLYDLKCVCSKCGYRGDNISICPECGSSNIISGYGKDTNIFISKDNLTDDITFSSNTDNVKNCFRLVAGDDLMTSTIKNCNPNGSSYIWYISKDIKEDMPKELVEKLEEYDSLYEYYKSSHICNLTSVYLTDDVGKYITTNDEYMLIADIGVSQYNDLINKYKSLNKDLQPIILPVIGYPSLMKIIYEIIDFRLYLNDGLLPSISTDKKTAETQAILLNKENLSLIAINNISAISKATADSNVLAMAKIIVGSKFKVKINDSSFNKETLMWKGNFVVTNYSDSDDTAISSIITIQISDNYEKYVKQKLDKILTDNDTDDYSVSELFKTNLIVTKDISGNIYSGEFAKKLGYYGLSYLKNIYDCCQSCLDILVEQGVADGKTWANSNPNLYETLYLDYYNKLAAIEYEINVREFELQVIDVIMDIASSEQENIQNKLNFQKFIGDELWKVFVSYRRDDEYSNTNYISDGLNNAELFKKSLEFIKVAEKEIMEAATTQHTLSSTLNNLLVIKDFEKLLNHFEVGNWLRINVDGNIYKLRLLSYDIDFDNLSKLNVEFSDVIYVGNVYSDTKSIAKTVSSIASSYDYITRQASKGDSANKTIQNWVTNGLDTTLTKIVNNVDNQDIVYDSHGLLFRSYDFTTDSYLPTQLKVINSTLAITDDNWETTKAAVGKYIYLNPETNKMETAFGVNAEVLVGKLILGESLGIYNTSGSLQFNTDGFRITNGINTVTINPNSNRLFVLSNAKQDVFWVDTNGGVCIVGDGTALDISANNEIKGLSSKIEQTAEGIITTVSEIYETKDSVNETKKELLSRIEQTSEEISTEVSKKIEETKEYADNVAGNAEFNAIADTIEKLKSYSTTTEMNSVISQTAEGINSTVSKQITETKEYAEEVANIAEQNAKNDTVEKLKNYSTTTQMNSTIEQTAEGIITTVSEIYETKTDSETKKLDLQTQITQTAENIISSASSTYETKSDASETKSALETQISQTANVITQTVSETYETKTDANTKKSDLQTQIMQSSENIINLVSETYETKDNASITKSELQSQIKQTSESITSEVAKNQSKYDTTGYNITLFGYINPTNSGYKASDYNNEYYLNQSNGQLYLSNGTSWVYKKSLLLITSVLSSSIEQNATAITSKVSTSDFGTLVQQNSSSVKIAWNNISKYIQFESGELRIYDSAVTSTQKMVSKFNYNGSHFYRDNVYIGKIGTNNWSGDATYRGLVFDLEYTAQYMCWAAEDTKNAGSYTVKLIYHHSNSKEKNGLHLGCNFYVGGQLYVNDNVRTANYTDGSGGLYSNSRQVSLSGTTAKISGTGASFEASNGKFIFYNSTNLLVDCYNNLDMHNYDILNQSDARLKTNIEDTNVEALSKISGIEMKQFDWIENGEHVDIGVIAQQLQIILPDLVYEDTETGKLSIKMLEFIPYIIKAIQELNDKIKVNSNTNSSSYSISALSLRNTSSNNSSNNTWVDTYTMEEKTVFMESTKEPVENQLDIVEDKPIIIQKEKENTYE